MAETSYYGAVKHLLKSQFLLLTGEPMAALDSVGNARNNGSD